jgi:hypothetical protein
VTIHHFVRLAFEQQLSLPDHFIPNFREIINTHILINFFYRIINGVVKVQTGAQCVGQGFGPEDQGNLYGDPIHDQQQILHDRLLPYPDGFRISIDR